MIVQNSKIFKVSFGKQKFFGFCKVRNHSRMLEMGDFLGFIRYCALLIRVETAE